MRADGGDGEEASVGDGALEVGLDEPDGLPRRLRERKELDVATQGEP
jgi:hypothetical protein